MKAKPGRKSAADLATVSGATPRAPAPDAPYDLPQEAADVWRTTLEALPSGWIGTEAHDVLASYCRTAVALRRLGQLMHAEAHGSGDFDPDHFMKLTAAHAKQAQTLKTLATALRLTPQTRQRASAAARVIDAQAAGPKPWET